MNNINDVKMTYQAAINLAISESMENDENVILLGEDIGKYGGAFGVTRGLYEKFGPARVVDTPIAENSFIGVATGAALTGLRPIVEIMFMDFVTLAMDQIVNHLTKMNYMYGDQCKVPMIIRTPFGGGRGYGPSHSQSLEAWFMHVPGLKIAAPSNAHDAKWLLKAAVEDGTPWLYLENKKLYGVEDRVGDSMEVPVGKARTVCVGKDCTIITYSRMVLEAIKAAEMLKGCGIYAEVIDLRTLCPIDDAIIVESVNRTKCAVIVEEGCKTGGVGAEITSRIQEYCFSALQKSILRIAAPDSPISACVESEINILPNAKKIYDGIRKLLEA